MTLASASPRRRELLASLGITVTVVPSDYHEVDLAGVSPTELAMTHARGKATGAHYDRSLEAVVIGADTVVDVDGEAFGKPRDARESRAMIARLSGREHVVHTAFSLRDAISERSFDTISSTRVRFYALDDAEIDRYVATGDGLDKAGAYGIQGRGATLVERIDGDFYTVMGFPLGAFVRALPALGWHLGASA